MNSNCDITVFCVYWFRIKTKENEMLQRTMSHIFPSHHTDKICRFKKFLSFAVTLRMIHVLTAFYCLYKIFLLFYHFFMEKQYVTCCKSRKENLRGRNNDTCLPLFLLFRIFVVVHNVCFDVYVFSVLFLF